MPSPISSTWSTICCGVCLAISSPHSGAVRLTRPRVQQTQVVVHLGNGADGGAGLRVGGLLVDRHRRRQTLDEVDVGFVHLPEELPGIGRQRFDVAALAFGEDRVERERRLARPDSPVKTIRLSRGKSTSIPRRLCSRAPQRSDGQPLALPQLTRRTDVRSALHCTPHRVLLRGIT